MARGSQLVGWANLWANFWANFWAYFRPLTGISSHNAGPTRATRANPVRGPCRRTGSPPTTTSASTRTCTSVTAGASACPRPSANKGPWRFPSQTGSVAILHGQAVRLQNGQKRRCPARAVENNSAGGPEPPPPPRVPRPRALVQGLGRSACCGLPLWRLPGPRAILGPPGRRARARSHCRFPPPPIHFIPDPPRDSVPLFLKRQCDRTPGTSPCSASPGTRRPRAVRSFKCQPAYCLSGIIYRKHAGACEDDVGTRGSCQARGPRGRRHPRPGPGPPGVVQRPWPFLQ
jgi:hypothetical protein